MLIIGVAAVLVATLAPARTGDEGWSTCLVCGSRGVADVILNFALFVPLGAGIGLLTRRVLPAGAAALLLSVVVELLQQAIPGRDPSLRDLLFNSLGGLGGGTLVPLARAALNTSGARSTGLAVAWSLGAAAVIGATGLLAEPSLPDSTYFGQWTPRLGHLEPYGGRVLNVTLGGAPVGRRRIDSGVFRERFIAGDALHATFVAGPPPARVAPIFSVFDGDRREILLVGAEGPHLVLHLRTRSRDLLLDQPDVRLWDALEHVLPGDTVRVQVRRSANGLCASADGVGACGIGLTAGSGWSLLYALQSSPEWVRVWLGRAWLCVLLLPAGLFARTRRGVIGALAAAALAMLWLPPWVGLQATPPGEILAAAVGVGAGMLLRRLLGRHHPGSCSAPPDARMAETRLPTHLSMRR